MTTVGYQAAYSNTTGSTLTAIGRFALYANTTGSFNIAVGDGALGANTTASNNTAVGFQASYSSTTGGGNAIFGYQSGYSVTTGSGNTLIGSGSGNYGTGITTGNNNTIIGNNSSVSAVGDSQSIIIGQGVTGKGTNTGFINPNSGGVYQGNNSATWSITSDQRLKKNIVDNTEGLSIISQIRVRNFEYRTAEEVTELPAHSVIDKQGVQLGVIAQELQAVLPECVKTESTGVMTVDTDPLVWYLVNAVKELTARVAQLESKGASA